MKQPQYLGLALSVMGAAILASCGGGSNSSTSSAGAPSDTIGGTVAVGAPMDSGTVKVLDSRGLVVASGIAISASGRYVTPAFNAASFTPPFVIVAEGQVFDAIDTQVAVVNGAGTANITPLSSAVAAGIVGDKILKLSDPSIVSALTGLSTSAVTNGLESMRATVAPLYAALGGTASANPLTSSFNDAFDKLLDNLKVDIKPSGVISILQSESQMGNDDAASSSSRPTALTSLTGAALSLPASGRRSFSVKDSELVALVAKLNNCLAAAPNSSGGRGTMGSGAATACQGLVLTAGDNTAATSETYINDGKTALEDLANVLTGSTGWEQGATVGTPQILRQIDNTTAVVQFPIQGTAASGNQRNSLTTTIKLYSTLSGVSGTAFRMIGNQRKYNVSITASALKVITTQSSGAPVVTYEPSLNIRVGVTSSIDSSIKVGAAHICGPGLPGYVSDANPCGTRGGVWMADAGLGVYSGAAVDPSANRCGSGLTMVPFRVFSSTANDNDAANVMYSPTSGETFSSSSNYSKTAGLNCMNNFRLASVDANGTPVANSSRSQSGAAYLSNFSGTPLGIGQIQAGDAYRVYLFGAASSASSSARQSTAINTPNSLGYYVVRLPSRPLSIAEITTAPFAVFDPALVSSYQSFKTAGPALASGKLPVAWTYETGAVKVNVVNLQYNTGGDQCTTRFSPLAPPPAFPASYVSACSSFSAAASWLNSATNISLTGQDRFGTLFISRLQ